MHRFYLPSEECHGTMLTLSDREAHHATQVLRIRSGEEVAVHDGAGHEFLCEVQTVSRKMASLAVRQKNFTPPLPYQITLLQSVPKGKIIESIIQKATELGVARIVPILAERVTTQLDTKSSEDKLDKWRVTTVEAMKQCGQKWLPRIEAPQTPNEFLAHQEQFELPLVAALRSDARHPREYFEIFSAKEKRKPRSVCIWVGPEGDFTASEMEALKTSGVLPITLGRLVLRCETAAIYCLSFLNYEMSA